jgi:hypothetical protein
MTANSTENPTPPVGNRLRHGVLGGDPRAAPRCGARTRADTPCKGPAMANGRCRMHGGSSTGPRTPKGLARIRAAQTTHGMRTAEMEELRALVRTLRAGAKRLVELT